MTLIINYAWVLSHSFFNFLAGVKPGWLLWMTRASLGVILGP